MIKKIIRNIAEQEFYELFKKLDIDEDNEDELWLKELYICAFVKGMSLFPKIRNKNP